MVRVAWGILGAIGSDCNETSLSCFSHLKLSFVYVGGDGSSFPPLDALCYVCGMCCMGRCVLCEKNV